MKRQAPKIIAVSVVVGALLYLAFASFGDAFEYSFKVSEFAAKVDQIKQRDVRVEGKIIEVDKPTPEMRREFVMAEGGKRLRVSYTGVVPDTFKVGADAIAEGKMGPNQMFLAHHVMAKCPSKYEADKGMQLYKDPNKVYDRKTHEMVDRKPGDAPAVTPSQY